MTPEPVRPFAPLVSRTLQIAWTRKGWIAGPVLGTALLGAALGAALSEGDRFRSGVLLALDERARAETVFTLRSEELMAAVLREKEFGSCALDPAALAAETRVEVAGPGRLLVEVEASPARLAGRLAEAVVEGAARRVRSLVRKAGEEAMARVREIEADIELARPAVAGAERELVSLRERHEFTFTPQGEAVSASRARLADRTAAAEAQRVKLRAKEAEIASLEASLDGREGAGGSSPPVDRTEIRRRVEEIEGILAVLRRELTDAHPRVATLLAERERLRAEAVVGSEGGGPGPAPSAAVDLRRKLAAARADLVRTKAALGVLEEEVREARSYVDSEGAGAERGFREISDRLERGRSKVTRLEELRAAALLDAERRRPAGPLLTRVDTRGPVRVAGGPSPVWMALAAGALGLVLGGFLAGLAEAIDPVIRTDADLARALEVPVLATVSTRGPRSPSRGGVGAAVWLAAFLAAAALILLLVYPRWGGLKRLLGLGTGNEFAEGGPR